jgi:hypothetical protein
VSVLFSTNPWFAVDVTTRYRGGVFFAWVSEYFDSRKEPPGTAASMVAASANPCQIYRNLREAVFPPDDHSLLIKGYKRKFTRLARDWLSDGSLSREHHDEIVAEIRGKTWTIWRPVLYVISRQLVEARLISVPRPDRAGHGPELQIKDLQAHEFKWIELDIL